MTGGSEERFAELVGRALDETESCPEIEALAAVAAGEVEAGRALRLRSHATTCPRCAAELRLAEELLSEAGATQRATNAEETAIVRSLESPAARWRGDRGSVPVEVHTGAEGSPRARRPRAAVWRLAAALVVAVGGLVLFLDTPRRESLEPPGAASVLRGGRLEVVAPRGRVAERPEEIRWFEVEGAASYRVAIERVDRSQVWSAQVEVPVARLPVRVRDSLRTGTRYTYSIAAIDTDGRVIAASSAESFVVDSLESP